MGEGGGQDLPRSVPAAVAAVSARTSAADQHPHSTKTDVHSSEFCAIRTLRQVSYP